ncbi:MAG: rRNA pseudouridine synthase [Bryobacteraceae bacterium]|nr:rRNA pseudouridine synthase [Bryobacteraceae bacterium]
MSEDRLQKILSHAGVTSRRKAEQMIVEGRVTVNGTMVTELGTKADLSRDHIKVDGKLLRRPSHLIYLAFNKPREVVTTLSDPQGRTTVLDHLQGMKERVYPVGRLDYYSEGLLLLTNDGEFANRITSAKMHIEKWYVVKANGALTEDQMEEFRSGVFLYGRPTAPAKIKLIKNATAPWYEVRLTEGRQNQIRMMFRHFGRLVEKLRRVRVGFLELDQKPGEWRHLTAREVDRFRRVLKMEGAQDDAD